MKAGLVRQISVSKVIPAPINSDIYRQPGAEDGLDVETFNAELEKEKEEAVELDAMRQRMLAAMGGGP
jgi:hypothetical protein